LVAQSPDPETLFAEHRERKRMLLALSRLNRRDRDVLLLAAVGGLTLQEAADSLGITLSAAKMRAMRARERLRRLLGEGTETRDGAD
jgi:RNA polymerase sigma factor (sigma-70 family)